MRRHLLYASVAMVFPAFFLVVPPGAGAGLDSYSPFLPAGARQAAAPATGGPIELHGYMKTPEGEKFSIYDPAKKSAVWVGLNETGRPFVVRSHRVNGRSDQITVEYQGSTLVLPLKEAKTISAAPPAVAAPLPALNPGLQPGPVELPPAASLQDWAAEVQRRRELRMRAGAAPAAANGNAPEGLPPRETAPTER